MENKFTVAVVIAVVCAALTGVFGYRQTKTSDQNRRLQEQVATLEQQNGDLAKRLDRLSASYATLQHENEGLKAENEDLKTKHGKAGKAAATH